MSEHMKARPTKTEPYILVTVGLPGKKSVDYKIPNVDAFKKELNNLLEAWSESLISSWEEATPWEELAEDQIKKHGEIGLILRGARYREGLSQKELAKRTGISQDNLSRMENGKRLIGEKVAKKLAQALGIDYRLLLKDN